jgi:Mrp family chromosome partitioning ATPase
MAISERATGRSTATAAPKAGGLLITDSACPPDQRQAYQQTYLSTRFALLGAAGNTLLVSALDGSATAAPLAANMAILAAQEGESVLLVDADPFTAPLSSLFTLVKSTGFVNLIRQEGADVAGAIQETLIANLRLVAAGEGGGIPGGLGRARALREVLLRLKNAADRLILIGTPILTHVDSLDLCPLVDGVVVTMTPGKTHREDAARARQVLDRAQAPLLGVVLTRER